MEMKDYSLTCGEVIDNLLMMADAYEKASAGKAQNGFAFNPTDAAANMKAAVHFIGSFGQQLPRWIPVWERLPEGDEPEAVLGWNGIRVHEVVFCPRCKEGDRWSSFGGHEYVTHWMPMPEPPEVK